jgi:hypothetical protein
MYGANRDGFGKSHGTGFKRQSHTALLTWSLNRRLRRFARVGFLAGRHQYEASIFRLSGLPIGLRNRDAAT